MLSRAQSVAYVGTQAHIVDIEVHVQGGLPAFAIVGMPAKSVREADQRVRAALASSGESWPNERVVANLAPGALRKEGTHFDLAIALGLLAAKGKLPAGALDGWIVVGELALDGSVRQVPGTLAAAMTCKTGGCKGIICPLANAPEGKLVEGIEVVPVSSLGDCIGFCRGSWKPPPFETVRKERRRPLEDMSEVRGHWSAKRAAEIAAAGGHNLLLIGPPGSGKTMLARRFPGIMPPMSRQESLEVTRVYSVAGLLDGRATLIEDRPFRSPHHHVSLAGLIGGGTGMARPGEVSFAHRGVLFLDELPLYRRDVLESLRAPLEEGIVRIARSGGVITYPCSFSLIAALNPCPCGYSTDSARECRCSPQRLHAYRSKLSGPLIDRMDLQVDLKRLSRDELLGSPQGETSAAIRARIESARAIQKDRYKAEGVTNATASKGELEAGVQLSPRARSMLGDAIDNMFLTGRGLNRVLRIARTIADLGGESSVDEGHVGAALAMRLLDPLSEVAA